MAVNAFYYPSLETILTKTNEQLWSALWTVVKCNCQYTIYNSSRVSMYWRCESPIYLRMIILHNWDAVIIVIYSNKCSKMSAWTGHWADKNVPAFKEFTFLLEIQGIQKKICGLGYQKLSAKWVVQTLEIQSVIGYKDCDYRWVH